MEFIPNFNRSSGSIWLFDESLPACEDYGYWLRFCAVESVAYVDELLLKKYGGHADQLSQATGAWIDFV